MTYNDTSPVPDETFLDDKEALLTLLLAEQGLDVANDSPISPRDTTKPPPLSFAQQRLWFLDQLEPGNPAYNIPLALRLRGALDVVALEESLNAIIRRHEALRTTFRQEAGRPVQVIVPHLTLSLPVQDGREWANDEATLQERLTREAAKPFDLKRGPLLRATLFQSATDTHILLLTIHHIIADGWSLGRLLEELTTFYAAHQQGTPADVPPLSIQYADFAVWQREFLLGETLEKQLTYWREQLAEDLPVLDLPTDHPRPTLQTFRGAQHLFNIPTATAEALRHLSQQAGVTLFMTLLAAFKSLLYRYTGQADILVGTPIANRNRQEIEPLIGFFVNTLLLRTQLTADLTFNDLLKQVQTVALGAYDHQDLPIEKLMEVLQPERDLSRNPLFQVMFILQNAPMPVVGLPGLTATPLTVDDQTAKFDLTLAVTETAEGLSGLLEYNTDLFEPETIERMANHFQTLLESVIRTDGATSLADLTYLTEAERHTLLIEWNRTARDYDLTGCLHHRFEAQAARTPNAVAFIYESERLTYEALNRRANQLAHYLRQRGVGSETLVGISMERSLDMLVGLLAVLKAGGAYVPLDPHYPLERLRFILEDTQAPLLLTQGKVIPRLPDTQAEIIALDEIWPHIAEEPDSNPDSGSSADSAAYVIYTSGSTGRPKGVLGLHRGALNRFEWMWERYPFAEDEVCCQKTTLNFVDSVWEIFGPLLKGIPTVLIPDEAVKDPRRLLDRLATHRVTRLVLVPSLLRVMLDTQPDLATTVPDLKLWVTSGEALTIELNRQFHQAYPAATLLNLYGSSEVSADSTYYETGADDTDAIPIGRPIANTQVYVLDGHQQPVPVGVPGELHIGGDGLARGYLNRPDLTAEKFIATPFSHDPQARLYKTGDWVRYRPDGQLDFLGRIDHQIKIRGMRVELGEIEAALRQHHLVTDGVVVTTADGHNLVAYVTTNQPLETTMLRDFLLTKLPDYMVPITYVHLEAMPLTPNGKINRQALPQADLAGPVSEKMVVHPDDLTELQLTHIFEHILEVQPVSVTDNFFELGGHSLLTIRLLSEIENRFGRELPLMTIFQAPTVQQLAAILRKTDDPQATSALVPLRPYGSRPPLFFIPGNLGNVFVDLGHLARHLKGGHPLYGLQDGVDKPSQIEALAAHYLEAMRRVQPDGPYLLGGICSGAVVVYEMAQQLVTAGQRVDLLALIEPARPPKPGLRTYARLARHLAQRSLHRFKHQSQQLAQLEYGEQETFRQLKAKLVANLWGMNRYQPGPYAGHIQLFFAEETFQGQEQDPRFGWVQLAKGATLHIIPGSHDTITGNNDTPIDESHMQALAQQVQECLAQIYSEEEIPTQQ